jgi:hypothetical protein
MNRILILTVKYKKVSKPVNNLTIKMINKISSKIVKRLIIKMKWQFLKMIENHWLNKSQRGLYQINLISPYLIKIDKN